MTMPMYLTPRRHLLKIPPPHLRGSHQLVGSLFSYKLLSPRENLKRTLTNTGHTHGMNTCVLSAVEIWNKTRNTSPWPWPPKSKKKLLDQTVTVVCSKPSVAECQKQRRGLCEWYENGSVESTHKVPTSHYPRNTVQTGAGAAVASLGGLTHRRGLSRIRTPHPPPRLLDNATSKRTPSRLRSHGRAPRTPSPSSSPCPSLWLARWQAPGQYDIEYDMRTAG